MSAELPMSEPTFLVLLSLARTPRHGYAILKEVESLSDGRVVLSTGTLYGALQRLTEAGWVRRVTTRGRSADRRRGATYVLTAAGRGSLAAECERMRSLARLGRRHLAAEVVG